MNHLMKILIENFRSIFQSSSFRVKPREFHTFRLIFGPNPSFARRLRVFSLVQDHGNCRLPVSSEEDKRRRFDCTTTCNSKFAWRSSTPIQRSLYGRGRDRTYPKDTDKQSSGTAAYVFYRICLFGVIWKPKIILQVTHFSAKPFYKVPNFGICIGATPNNARIILKLFNRHLFEPLSKKSILWRFYDLNKVFR